MKRDRFLLFGRFWPGISTSTELILIPERAFKLLQHRKLCLGQKHALFKREAFSPIYSRSLLFFLSLSLSVPPLSH